MTIEQDSREIEQIRQLKARYVRLGDTKSWDEFRKLFTQDFVGIFDVLPRNSRSDPLSATIEGLDAFISAMSAMLVGVTTVHQVFSSEIVLTGPNSATGIWGMHDFVQMPNCIFKGWGHYHELYVQEKGVWKIKHSRTTRLFFEELWR
jgi:SnoaL-like domain